jgi:hypothetical protein
VIKNLPVNIKHLITFVIIPDLEASPDLDPVFLLLLLLYTIAKYTTL